MSPTEEVKSRLDIVDVISEYVALKPAGANWKACCPFHEEKTASFMVSKAKQMWHCFGCGEGGDMFSFIMKQEGFAFPDALRLLGAKAGVQVRAESPTQRTERERLGQLLAAAVQFWQETLWHTDEGKAAREYLLNARQILPATIREWRLGYAADSWDALTLHLSKQGFTEEEMAKAGVAVRKATVRGRGAYDRFRKRIVFPLTNAHGQVVGATARAMPGDDSEAKYVNTPETAIYKKGEVLYGLDKGKAAIRQQRLAVAVEGNVDVISSHQAGIVNVVAASGTALTDDQVRLIARYTPRLAFAFDADTAGEAATMRGILAALGGGLEILLIALPNGPHGERFKDPDECIRSNPELWRQAIQNARPLFDRLLERARTELTLTNLEEKRNFVREFLTILGRIADPVATAHYLQELAAVVAVPEADLRQVLQQSKARSDVRGTAVARPAGRPASAVDPWRLLSERFIAALITVPAETAYAIETIHPDMVSELVRPLYKEIVVFYTGHSNAEPPDWLGDAFQRHLNQQPHAAELQEMRDVISLLADKEFSELPGSDVRQELLATATRLKRLHLQRKLKRLEHAINEAEQTTPRDDERLRSLIVEFQTLGAELTNLETS